MSYVSSGAAHQEAAERVHALPEGDAARGPGRVHAQGVRRHQPDPRPQGEYLAHRWADEN